MGKKIAGFERNRDMPFWWIFAFQKPKSTAFLTPLVTGLFFKIVPYLNNVLHTGMFNNRNPFVHL